MKIQRHLAECEECRAWVDTSELLSKALSARDDLSARSHLSCEELVSYALQPETLAVAARQRIGRHPAFCSQCRDEMQTIQMAVSEAREAADAEIMEPALNPGPSIPYLRNFVARIGTPVRLAISASLLLLLSTGVWLGLPSRLPDERALMGQVIDGERTISARRSIVIGVTRVNTGARVVLESGEIVAFGDGFSVDEGASLTVSTGGTLE